MHYVLRQGLQCEWRRCKGMLDNQVAERRRPKLQALERYSRWELEREGHNRLEA